MQSLINVYEMPAVLAIIDSAEKRIKKLSGVEVALKIEGFVYSDSPEKKILKDLISREFRIDWEVIKSKSKQTELVEARTRYSWLAVKILGQTLPSTGRDLNRDHTTIVHALQKMSQAKKDGTSIWRKTSVMMFKLNVNLSKHEGNKN